jgi:hypothetical protein
MLLPTDGPVKEMLANLSHLPGGSAQLIAPATRAAWASVEERVAKATLAPAAPLDSEVSRTAWPRRGRA